MPSALLTKLVLTGVSILVLFPVTSVGATLEHGAVKDVSETRLTMVGGQVYDWAAGYSVRRLGKSGDWRLLVVGDRVEVGKNSAGRAMDVNVLAANDGKLQIKPLGETNAVNNDGLNEKKGQISIRGRIFSKWLIMQWGTFHNQLDADFFECVIGHEQGDYNGEVKFTVRSEDDVLYTSPWMNRRDAPITLSLPVKGKQSVTLMTEWKEDTWVSAIWADPVFVKYPDSSPRPALPAQNAVLKGSGSLVWEKVSAATGYLLEVQCTQVDDSDKSTSAARFQVITLEPDADTWKFDVKQMPTGSYRWRVHALGPKGFLGESVVWRYFTLKSR